MTKFADVNELFELPNAIDLPENDHLKAAVVEAMDDLGQAIARALGIHVETTINEPEFGGLLVAFKPIEPGQPCPVALVKLNESGEWGWAA
jgi:hypothetical protein